ncbi:MAG: hypothetical protein A2268_08905 [Candidatus Raymondbacteria bacterium RifOxyA12_full_50_37]|uniref:O-antigen ligase-related domain-containing protein n=1 Tax=Candidatus Raymondbacteria bacterium RIFOXYD12_FULL_49_13 TaxID=1817890 RepID=A0A1F7FGS4_UNCRA|nr:MAG: hypothetical protein A2350_19825 [Candidatus Raymondbacteria bacterium RifOxyB12_full_50_8]OGJ91611.1 MAG: hypothetical protein A2268_08905 [Candidatus Raymondbacteria bacterium RifOxyA12_full_50_37]OGJ92917.1 MAG: hypothetical protein A2248_08605 [Candidatus Raymondbacteria bacterium RIFOXYA2_FULL_49_16]OGJ94843.1 MAG: hypothetical protein A2487_03310 [Candidatus Raymondbacteria bacterium RifOxyC12_full_50_8]OGK05697.1 MAG: hypothetical protein A2519_03865 [Candidatus Raymondbacteria b
MLYHLTPGFWGVISAIVAGFLGYLQAPSLAVFICATIAGLLFLNDPFKFLLYIFASFILLMPIEKLPAVFLYWAIVHVIDPIVLLFIIVYFFNFKKSPFEFHLSVFPALIAFMVFLGYQFLLFFKAPTHMGRLYGIFELREYAYALLTFFIILRSNIRHKRMIQILFFIIVLASIGGALNSAGFYYRHLILGLTRIESRQLIHLSFFFSQCFLICIIGLTYFKNKKVRIFLGISGAMLGLSMLIDQTRGMWIGTAVALLVYISMMTSNKLKLIRKAAWLLPMLVCAVFIAKVTIGIDVLGIITQRFGDLQPTELINPFTSMGYRVYESLMVLQQTSVFGHGFKAPLHLYLPFFNKTDDWYGIHDQYLDILYNTGVVGLILFFIFAGLYLVSAYRLSKDPNSNRAFWGKFIFLSFINTLMISITSGFFNRFSSCLFLGYTLAALVVFSRYAKKRSAVG